MAQAKTTRKRNRSSKSSRELKTMSSGTNVRFVEPTKSKKRRASKPKVVTIVAQTDDVLLDKVSGFANFLKEYAVVGLAVGFIVGQQANTVVKQLVASFVSPWVQVLFGQSLLKQATTLHHKGTPVEVPWGAFVYVLIEFFLVLITIYAVIKIFKLDRLKKVEIK